MLALQDIKESVDEAGLLLGLHDGRLSRGRRRMVGVTHVSEVEFSLPSCVCVWVEGCSYAIPQHTHVHLSYSGSGLASPDGWSGGWEPILNCKVAAGWAAMCRDAPDSTGTRIKYSSVHDRVVCRNSHAEIRGLPRQVRLLRRLQAPKRLGVW